MSTPPSQPSLENLPCSGTRGKKKHMWRMDEKTLEYRGIKILNKRIFFIPSKQNYSKHVERIEMWKKMGEGQEA
jgi:hypothetical protein